MSCLLIPIKLLARDAEGVLSICGYNRWEVYDSFER